MAITWDVKITVLQFTDRIVSLKATRIDSDHPENPLVYEVARAPVVTGAQKLAVMEEILTKHQAYLAKQAQIDALVGTLEADAQAYLEARE